MAKFVMSAAAVLMSLVGIGKLQNANGSEHFRSDGSNHPSKQCDGKLFKLGRSKTGLRMYIRTADGKVRIVNQRMTQETVTEVLSRVYQNNYRRIDGGVVHVKHVG